MSSNNNNDNNQTSSNSVDSSISVINKSTAPHPSSWNNDNDYRFPVTVDDIRSGQKDWQVAAQSVATFVKKEDFTAVNSKNPREGYRIVLREKALWHSIQNLAGAANLDHYRFWTNKIISDSSGYYIGNGLVVTAGHVIIGSASVEAKTTEKWRVVFGLTEEYCRPDQQQSYPAEKMFILDEILFKLKDKIGEPVNDCCDWALLRIRPEHPDLQPAFPPPLHILPPQASYTYLNGPQNMFALGHPFGTPLKLTDPISANIPLRTLLDYTKDGTGKEYRLQYSLRHSLITNSGNSGGPLFLRRASGESPVVIGTTVTNGRHDSRSYLNSLSFHYHKPTNEARIDVPETDPSEVRSYNIATNTTNWYNLVNSNASITIIHKLTPELGHSGYLTFYLHVLLPPSSPYSSSSSGGSNASSPPDGKLSPIRIQFHSILYSLDRNPPIIGQKLKITKPFASLLEPYLRNLSRTPPAAAAAMIKPCHIIGLETEFLFAQTPSSSVARPTRQGKLDFVAVVVSSGNGEPVVPGSDVCILREAGRDANTTIERPVTLEFEMMDRAREDERGAVVAV